ncbi:MAG: N-acetylmuramoyl-L-alanine amidase [Phycisphaerae bacterium]|nr:N-acetylmuramoyl-L-alanine amidase [Phycisphaerae bacterium]
MKKFTLLVLSLVFVALAVSGCQQPAKRNAAGVLAPDEQMVNLYYLAGRLEMKTSLVTDRKIVLSGGGNNIAIFPKDNYIYFNDKYFGTLGKTKNKDGLIYVRSSLEEQIRKEIVKTTPAITPVIPKTIPKPTKKSWADGEGRIIVIDPGHGGKDPGAISPHGFYEKTVNLDVALQIAGILKDSGFRIIMTRSNDTFIELDERANIANRNNALLFISIHADSCATSGRNGFTVYVAKQAGSSARNLAEAIDRQMTGTGIKSHGTRQADYRVLKNTRCPAVLVEMGYLSNYWEAKQLKDKNMQRKLAVAITNGIINYVNRSKY